MKYIPADKLIAEIERLKEETPIGICEYDKGEENGRFEVLNHLLSTIASLQQDKDVLDLCSQVWWADRGWMMIPPNVTLKGIESLLERVRHKIKWNKENGIKEQEQPEVDLENYISGKLRELGADLINHKPYSFNRGLNVGKTNAYNDILDRLNARKEE